eukprot:CAMPEP_0201591164 /NCGR_PEP_ID=MMETSP0190_2-20130828/186176_1 /ASSEMBLY_ACC=CAM_ASM_000263 /TAXON_ID=37353 /ORGANISM="Rosalina sp." /LENGTH=337 /DNA_ID=CAMNT_0048048855 /DNA_START=148 /DNA_END=1158 /DNA_ORIENTATION=+
MGWNAWYAFGCNVTEDLVRQVTDKFLALGLDKLGYEYINLDDCWAGGRYKNGTVYGQSPQFNSSLKPLADFVHSKNLKFGLYTDRGTETCKQRPGSFGYEVLDANTYAAWEVDYLKEDSCYAIGSNITVAFAEYAVMRDALNATNRPIFFSLCHGTPKYGPIGMSLGNSWRIGTDDNSWQHILDDIDTNAQYELHRYSGRGGWNDPCLLLANGPHAVITPAQSRAQFSMWAVMSSPLLISSDIRNISQYVLETYTNRLVIDVNQDPAGKQGYRVQGGNLALNATSTTNIWSRELIDGSRAMVFLNVGSSTVKMTCDEECFNNAGFYDGVMVQVYDLW